MTKRRRAKEAGPRQFRMGQEDSRLEWGASVEEILYNDDEAIPLRDPRI